MSTQTEVRSPREDAKTSKRIVSGDTVVGYSTLGCLVAGTLGIFKAMVSDGFGAAICLLAAVAAFATVCYIYFRKD